MKDTTPRETGNVSGTQHCCTSREISIRCTTCSETGGRHFETLQWS